MTSGLAAADYTILAGFFIVLLAIGLFYSGRMSTLRDFFSGGRHVPWWLAGISLYMTTFSAFTFVSYSALAYKHGFVAVAIWWFSIPGCLLSAWFLASRWRRAASTSPVEYLETRYGHVLRQSFSWFGIPLIVLDDALKLYVIGTMMRVSMGFESDSAINWIILFCGIIMVLYTLLGGLWAVLITDFIQFVVMGVAVLVLLPLTWRRAGGMGAIADHLPTGFGDITVETYTWPWLLSFAVVLALTFATKWPYVQRYYAARTDQEARWVGYLVAALTLLGPPLLFFPAFGARVYLPEVADANQVYALLCKELLPAGLMGMMIAAMFSATMSMLSSDYNSVASVVTNDIVKRLFMKHASEKSLVLVARLSTLAIGLLAMGLALLIAQAKTMDDLVKIMAQLFAALLPPVALPMAAGLLWRRATNGGALMGFALGATCGIAASIASYTTGMSYLREVQYLTWLTLLPTAAGLGLGSLLFADSADKSEQVRNFMDGLQGATAHVPEPASKTDAAVAMRIIGLTTLLLGSLLFVSVLLTAGLSGRVSLLVGLLMAAGGMATYLKSRAILACAQE
ncbi:MAG: hypothetical protein AMXMBFR84_15050 [Candidatus Hydrogenedentota bacterium]